MALTVDKYISAGTTKAPLYDLVLSNSNGISIGINGKTITFSHNGLSSQSNQAWSGSNASSAFQTLVFNNTNGISWSNNAGSVEITHGLQYTSNTSNITANALNTSVSRVINILVATNSTGGGTSSLSSNISFSNANGISFYSSAGNAIVGSVRTDYASSDHSHGNPTLALTNLSGTTASNSAGLTLSLSAANPSGGGLALANSQTTYTSGTAHLSAAGALTIQSTTGQSYQFSVPNTSSLSATGNLSISTNGQTISIGVPQPVVSANNGSYAFNTLVFSNANGISAGTSGGSVISFSHNALTSQSNQAISAGNGSFTFQTASFADSNGVSFSTGTQGLYATVATNYAVSNHSHGDPTLALTNLSGTTASASNGFTLSLSAAAPGAGGGIALANSQTTYTSGTALISGSGALTVVSTTGQKFFLAVPSVSTLSGTGQVSLSTNGNVISVGVPNKVTLSGRIGSYMNEHLAAQIGQSSVWVQPLEVAAPFQYDRFVIPVNFSNATNSSNSASLSFDIGLYTRNGSTLSLLSSVSSSYAISASGTQGSYSLWGGKRFYNIGWTQTVTEGNYWLAILSRTTTAGGAGMSWSQFVYSNINTAISGVFGVATNASQQHAFGMGSFSAQTAALPSSMAISDLRGTAAAALRPVVFLFASNTF